MRPLPKRFFRSFGLLSAAGAVLLLAGCAAVDGPQTTFQPRGDSAKLIVDLYKVFAVAAVLVFVIVEGILVYSVFRYRRKPEDGIPLQIHGNKPIEIAWTIIPAIIVLFLATMTFRTQALLAQPAANPLNVTVIGHQWWWEFRYPELGIVTANELHLPANRDVRFSLESADVIHSFWFPRLGGKTDAVPGHVNILTMRAQDTKGPMLIRGECAEFCGGTHAQMAMWAVVEPQAQFDTWARGQKGQAAPPAGVTQAPEATAGATTAAATPAATAAPVVPAGASPAARGYALFNQHNCYSCHAIEGRPEPKGQVGPNLTHVGSRQHIVAGWLQNTPENMQRWLRDPNEVKPDNIMGTAIKRGTLNEDEIAALTAYLESLK
jgi:cytochrome c oxidase subunit 2